ncbi:MAG TPA: hypothetical protein PKU69_00300 [Bacillota bacterium]|nr:hypothetical protein [Bacillota bacterium]
MSKKKTYAFAEIEQYREYLEIKNLRGKNIIVSGVFFVLLILTMTYMIIAKMPWSTILPLAVSFLLILATSFIFTAYGEEDFSYLKISRYILTLGMFSVVTAMIILMQSPSIIPLLFVVYCLLAIYQDIKVMVVSNIYFLFTMVFIVLKYPNLLMAQNSASGSNFSMTFFAILFLIMLSISSYIIMKEKSFFYNQISKSKEIEYRNIDLLIKLRHQTSKQEKDFSSYYDHLKEFLQAFSDKLELPNIFEEKINILIDLENQLKYDEILKKHPDFTVDDLDRLSRLCVSNKSALDRIALKMSKTKTIDIKRREIFSATHFKSFNKQSDSIEIRIIAFVIFYVALKKGLLGMDKISDEEIYHMITKTDYYYYIDSRVMKIYEENADVFEAIIVDAFGQGGGSR